MERRLVASVGTERRQGGLLLVWLALVWFALILPACFDLTKVDPGARIVDDFESGNLSPSWTRFTSWKCGTFTGSDQVVGKDGGADAGGPDPDGSVSCLASEPADTGRYALRTTFELNDPLGNNQPVGAAVVTRTTPGVTIDVTGFAQLWFSAYLESAPPLPELPSGTKFQVELGCSNNRGDPLAFQVVAMSLLAESWPLLPIQLSLDAFGLTRTTHNQDCLRQVDSIHFAVIPGLADGASTGGTLHLDDITLQN
jgi:hypothetical protein